jgi:hypothetical protein
VNGNITKTSILQQRGLRQGDPLSPLLFNIAFDPFLRSISRDPLFSGFNVPEEAPPPDHDTLSPSFSFLYNPSPESTTPLSAEIPISTPSLVNTSTTCSKKR